MDTRVLIRTLPFVALFAGCTGDGTGATSSADTHGRVVPVDADASVLPPGHPSVPVADPASNNDRVGRAAHRLNVDQLKEALRVATGYIWVSSRTVSDPDSPSGTSVDPQADMLEVLAATLGRADYLNTTRDSIDPAVTFAKLASDAARVACRAGVAADLAPGTTVDARRIVRYADPSDTLAAQPAHVRANLAYLALRFWARHVDPNDPQLTPLATLFERASTAPASRDANNTMRAAGTTADGWRAVCIAMATDPQFLTY